MKKLFFTALFSAIFMGSAFAQFNFNTNATIGQTLQNINVADKDTFIVDFNTTKANSTWAYTTAVPPVLALTYQKCQTQRGLQMKGFVDATTTSEYKFGTSDCNNYGANRNPIHVASIDSLKKIMLKSVEAATIVTGTTTVGTGGNLADSLSRPAACLFDVATGNSAFGLYPGKVKRVEYGFQFNFAGKTIEDDITFEISTYDAGTTGKTASYTLSVATGSESNVVFTQADFYVTGSGKKTVSLAAAMNVLPKTFTNTKVYIFLKTLGTSNALSVVDGLRNEVDVNNVPVVSDPTIVFDNFKAIYINATWMAPAGAVTSAYINHNNGSPIVTTSTDATYGNPVGITVATDSPIKFYLTSLNRVQVLNIKENVHSSFYSFPANAIKAKALDGSFTKDVVYSIVPADTNGNLAIEMGAPAVGTSVNDTLEVTVVVNRATVGNALNRYEITNGTRFWYNIAASASVPNAVKTTNAESVTIFGADKSIFATNATENVTVFNVTGQKMNVVSAAQAAQGIKMQQGIYIVKTGKTTQKVLVK